MRTAATPTLVGKGPGADAADPAEELLHHRIEVVASGVDLGVPQMVLIPMPGFKPPMATTQRAISVLWGRVIRPSVRFRSVTWASAF